MKPNFNEYIQYYLTDLEWLIIYFLLHKEQSTVSFCVFQSEKFLHKELENLLKSACLEMTFTPLTFKNIGKWKDEICIRRGDIIIEVKARCSDKVKLYKWVNDYVYHYQQSKIFSPLSYDYRASLNTTLYSLQTKKDSSCLSLSRDIMVGNLLKPNGLCFFEDLFILSQSGYIEFTDIRYTYKKHRKNLAEEEALYNRWDINLQLSLKLLQNISTIKDALLTHSQEITTNTQPQGAKPEPIHTIDYKRDFLPSDCMLVLLALYKTGNYIFLSKKATQLLQIIKQMPFLKIATGSDKHIRSKISKFHSIPQKFNIPKSDEITCIILTKKESLNEYLKNYLDRYQQDKLNNHSHYCLYNESWDRTIRMLNSLRAENGENYCITPGTIENKKTILNTRTSWIECFLILIRSGQIQLTEANLEWGHSLNFSLGITQISEIPLVKNALCEHLGISITLDNKVQYKGYPIKFKANSREFMFLKFLLLNKGAEGRNRRIVAQFFIKEYQKLGIKIDEKEITDDKLTAYQNAINKKFGSISKKVSLDFWITAGKTENKLEPFSSKALKRSRKRHKKSPRNL